MRPTTSSREALCGAAQIGFAEADSQGRIFRANAAFCRLTGYSERDLSGRTLAEITRQSDLDSCDSGSETQVSVVRSDGTLTRLGLMVDVVPDATGAPQRMIIVVRGHNRPDDVDTAAAALGPYPLLAGRAAALSATAERPAAEEALRFAVESCERQARLLEGIASTTPDFVYVFDLQGRFVYANRRLLEVWGMNLPEVTGKTCRDLGYEQWHHDMHMREIAQVIATRKPIKGEVPFRAPRTGVFGVYEYIFTPVLNLSGEVELIAGTTRDVTDRKRAEEALAAAQQELQQHAEELESVVAERTAKLREIIHDLEAFSYSIVHDMRAPLRSMQGFARVLLTDYGQGLDETGRNYLERIAGAAKRMDLLIQDVLSYSRVVRSEVQLIPVSVSELLEQIVETYPVFNSLSAEINLQGPFPAVLANSAMLTQCFSNLLGNAVKFVAPDVRPRVRVWSERRGARVRFHVEDNGIGIPAEYHEKIFRIFERLNSTYEGTGIGLAIVQKTVQRMGGTLGVKSEPDKGSCFWVELDAAGPG